MSHPITVLAGKRTIVTDEMNSPLHTTSSIPYPLTLSPSPTPISSPTLYTPTTPSSAGSQANIDKWKEIARQLSYYNELRSVWNQLKIKGGFSTNMQFISHLLHHEAARQCIHFDILSVNESSHGSEETQQDLYQSDNELSQTCSIHPSDTESTPSKYTESFVDREQHKEDGEVYKLSLSLEENIPLSMSPKVLTNESNISIERGSQEQPPLYQQSNSSSEFVLTVLDSQMQCTPNEPGTQCCDLSVAYMH